MQPMWLCSIRCRSIDHLKTHNGKKSYKCTHCDFRSAYTNVLKGHLKRHSGEKPNKCDQCDFKTAYKCVLNTHLKAHSGENPYQCVYTTAHSSALRAHLRYHAGEKPNKCDQCDYATSELGNLKEAYEVSQWRKVNQVQPLWLCNIWHG